MNRRNFFSMLCGALAAPFVPKPSWRLAFRGFNRAAPIRLGEMVISSGILNAPALVTVYVGGRFKPAGLQYDSDPSTFITLLGQPVEIISGFGHDLCLVEWIAKKEAQAASK